MHTVSAPVPRVHPAVAGVLDAFTHNLPRSIPAATPTRQPTRVTVADVPPARHCSACGVDTAGTMLGTERVELCPDCVAFHVVRAVGLPVVAELVDHLRTFESAKPVPAVAVPANRPALPGRPSTPPVKVPAETGPAWKPTAANGRLAAPFVRADWFDLDRLTRDYTAATSFDEFVGPVGETFFPTLRARSGFRSVKGSAAEMTRLADAYDACQAARGNPRRAFRT